MSRGQSKPTEEPILDGVEPVEESAEDTSQRASVYVQTGVYPFDPEPGMHYVLVPEHPESWGLESAYARYERMGYVMKCFANKRKTAAWYEIPLAIREQNKAKERRVREETRQRAREMVKTNSPSMTTWVETDIQRRGRPIINEPIKFNG